MVVNTQFRFIFVHIPKAAGTSVMNSLNKFRGNNRSWLANTKHETLAEFYRNIPRRRPLGDRLLDRDAFGFFTFGFVRHPWDRMSSFYRFLVEKRPRTEIDTISCFKDFLIQSRDGVEWIQSLYAMRPQIDYFTLDNGRVAADFIGHYEFLAEDFASVTESISCRTTLAHRNRSSNSSSDYRKMYDDEMIQIVGERFSEEIALFEYEFDNLRPQRRFSCPIDYERHAATLGGRTSASASRLSSMNL